MFNPTNQNPFIFLTSTTSQAASGRNARSHARAEAHARINRPIRPQQGVFSSFQLTIPAAPDQNPGNLNHPTQSTRSCKRKFRLRRPTTHSSQFPSPPLQLLTLSLPDTSSILHLNDILHLASYHIRRRASLLLSTHPHPPTFSRQHQTLYDPAQVLAVLRCRQWCAISASATAAAVHRTRWVAAAVRCVVAKTRGVVLGLRSGMGEAEYGVALQGLRTALIGDGSGGIGGRESGVDRETLLVVAQLLAVYEMLESLEGGVWVQHVVGAAAVAKMIGNGDGEEERIVVGGFGDEVEEGIGDRSGALFVEALMTGDRTFFQSEHWRQLLEFIIRKRYPSEESCGETIACLAALKSLYAASQDDGNAFGATRFQLLCQAHELRSRIKGLVLQSEGQLRREGYCSRAVDVLGILLASVVMLDKAIAQWRPADLLPGKDLEEDTEELCTQMLRIELHAYDAHPGNDLLSAFHRQQGLTMTSFG